MSRQALALTPPCCWRGRQQRQEIWVRQERARLIQKLQGAKKSGETGEKPTVPKGHYHCDDVLDEE